MSKNKYEKYVINKAMRPQDFYDKTLAGFMSTPPFIFLNGDKPIKGSNQFLEMGWVWAEGRTATNPDRPPHSHKFNEVFIFLGTNPQDPDDLGGEVEFWLGEGNDTEKYSFNTSTCIFIPKGLVHSTIIYKKVSRPFIIAAFGVNVGKEWVRTKAPRK